MWGFISCCRQPFQVGKWQRMEKLKAGQVFFGKTKSQPSNGVIGCSRIPISFKPPGLGAITGGVCTDWLQSRRCQLLTMRRGTAVGLGCGGKGLVGLVNVSTCQCMAMPDGMQHRNDFHRKLFAGANSFWESCPILQDSVPISCCGRALFGT